MILHLTESSTIHLGKTGFNLSAADPRAIARLSPAGMTAAIYAHRRAQLDASQGASAAATPPKPPVGGDAGTPQPHQFNGLAYGGGEVPSPFGGGALVIDLATLLASAPLPLLNLHDHSAVIGKVASVTNDGRQLTDAGELFSDFDPTAQGIAKRAVRGIPFQQSVGVYDFYEEEIRTGLRVSLNGREFIGPLTVLRNGTVREISICPLGADSTTSASIFGAQPRQLSAREIYTLRRPQARNQ